jgi:hypothetical protein
MICVVRRARLPPSGGNVDPEIYRLALDAASAGE